MNRQTFAVLILALVVTGPALAQAPLTDLKVYPPQINMSTSRATQNVVVQATFADGLTRDVTAQAKLTLANAALAKLDKNRLVPVADGVSELIAEFGGKAARVPLTIKDAAKDRAISFRLDVMPVFMRTGCNSGGCHGAARGKDGFRLSLFGFDAEGDHHRLTRELNGRRINLALPAESLLIEKSLGKVPHTGGQRFTEQSEEYRTLVRWLEASAPNDPATVAQPTGIEIYPRTLVLDGKGEKQQMVVRATYSDGTERDVTHLCLFLSSNDTSATIGLDGVVTAGDRGEAFVMARFATYTVGSQVIALPKGLQYNAPQTPEHNYVDTLVNAKLKKLRITPSEICTDEVFLRRVYLDVIGVLPTVEEYTRFMTSTDAI